MTTNPIPQFFYKVISAEAWQRSQESQVLELAPIDTDFIHLATEEQVARVVAKFWPDQDHVVLKLEASALVGRLVHESNPGGTSKYYHLHEGVIPWDAIVSA